jgi:hypothetical protein
MILLLRSTSRWSLRLCSVCAALFSEIPPSPHLFQDRGVVSHMPRSSCAHGESRTKCVQLAMIAHLVKVVVIASALESIITTIVISSIVVRNFNDARSLVVPRTRFDRTAGIMLRVQRSFENIESKIASLFTKSHEFASIHEFLNILSCYFDSYILQDAICTHSFFV